MASPQLRNIKRAQKEAHLLREISNLFLQISLDEPELQGMYVSRIKLSADGGICNIYFADAGGLASFEKKLKTLVLYKPSLRTALAKSLDSRYTPSLIFFFDELTEKQNRIDELLSKVVQDLPPEESDEDEIEDSE